MKIIGVEFRVSVAGQGVERTIEAKLFPVEIVVPDLLCYTAGAAYTRASLTVHTSHGDVNGVIPLPAIGGPDNLWNRPNLQRDVLAAIRELEANIARA